MSGQSGVVIEGEVVDSRNSCHGHRISGRIGLWVVSRTVHPQRVFVNGLLSRQEEVRVNGREERKGSGRKIRVVRSLI